MQGRASGIPETPRRVPTLKRGSEDRLGSDTPRSRLVVQLPQPWSDVPDPATKDAAAAPETEDAALLIPSVTPLAERLLKVRDVVGTLRVSG